MESQPQNPEFRNNPENFHSCEFLVSILLNNKSIADQIRKQIVPDQTKYSMFAILTNFLRKPALKTNILFKKRKRKVCDLLLYTNIIKPTSFIPGLGCHVIFVRCFFAITKLIK